MSIKIENTQVFGWEGAVRGARNPMNSWDKSDSSICYGSSRQKDLCDQCVYSYDVHGPWNCDWFIGLPGKSTYIIGPNDYKLLMNLCKGGTEEAKWRRMVHVQMDVTAPLYWWKEFETYKVGTVSNSCSTMHKIQTKEFTLDDFSCEHLGHEQCDEDIINGTWDNTIARTGFGGETGHITYPLDILRMTIVCLNAEREKFLETKDKKYWWQMIQLLPSSYNQRRTIDLNYEVLASQYRQRKDHKLQEWLDYCSFIKSLPYSEFITMEN